ncbi:hypothetical protein [Sphingomonas sp.]|uniref:hypothetical protein n=1 Tax=Sphingomonas sp. TaxID=28214 RepID=UPI002C095CB2|nr:hypothetical protein [Sphingomonas sp.]HWK36014.1 hypothetical protein [Sphingomonas sp.]
MTESQTPAANVIEAERLGYVEYEIDIERVLRTDLPGVLDRVPIAPLTPEAVNAIPAGAKGAYVLFENGHPVYAGKTDTRHGFRDRLGRHAFTIQHRQNLDPSTIGFKAIRILVFSNFDVEAILIDALRKADKSALRWNDSGFGSNDPGHNRERQEPAGFDVERPIDIDRSLGLPSATHALLDLLIMLKDGLPFTLRYQTDQLPGKKRPEHYRTGHADQRAAAPVAVEESDTLRSILTKALAVLPAGWRVTVFPDRVILYAETEPYPYAREYIPA